MRVTQYARRSLAAGALALALAGCSKDNNGPSEFNPQGTTADMTAAEGAFASAGVNSFAAVGTDISVALNGAPAVVGAAPALALRGPNAGLVRYARELAALAQRSGGSPISAASIPSQYLGTTFVWDEATDAYVPSDLPGAPSAGVRFKLYAIDPVLFRPVEPVVEVGYVDIVDHSTDTSIDVNVKVVEGGVVYLEYDVTADATSTGALIVVSGFASNGSTIANFELRSTYNDNAGSPVITFDYHLDVPSHDLSLDWTATISNVSDSEVTVTLDFAISGPHGNVRVAGTWGVNAGSLTVRVNGDLFATVNLEGGQPVITGAGGEPLTADEEATLRTILDFYEGSSIVFEGLIAPIA